MTDLRQLRYFVAVAEELHFSRAAARLHIAQPPLSQQIRRLERDLEVQLFHRDKRNVKLTEAGQVLLREARPLLERFDRAKALATRVGRGQAGRLSIGFIHSATYSFLPAAVRAFRERYPDVELALQEMHITRQLEALARDEIQLGVLRPPVKDVGIVAETLHPEPLLVALPADHKLAAEPRLSLKDLAQTQFIMAPRGRAGFFDWIKELCRQAGFEPQVSQEATDMHTAVSLVSVGLGVALVPEVIKRTPVANVVYRDLAERPMTELAIAWRRDKKSTALESFLNLARDSTAGYSRRLNGNKSTRRSRQSRLRTRTS